MADKMIFWQSNGQISAHLLYEFFAEHGIGKYFPDESSKKTAEPVIVKINGNIVSPVNTGFLLEMTSEHILSTVTDSVERGRILDSLHAKTSLFGDKNLKLLKTLQLQFISDTPGTGYLFFKNGVAEITGDGIRMRSYDELDDFVWEKSIIPFDFSVVDLDTLSEKSDFMKFLEDITIVTDPGKAEARLQSLESAVGYLLHRYKDPATTKAIILMDVYTNGQPGGGTGKTLLIQSIGKVRNLAVIDGKMYDQREWFALSSVDLSSEVLLFDDVGLEFRFEQIFPLVSTGMQIRRKYKDHIYIPFEKAPKVCLTTNYAITGDSSSFRRRKFELEISPTYSAEYSPRDKFGRNFFESWLDEDWNQFYNVMAVCMEVFLQQGLIESEPINMNLTKLISKSCEEFVEWAGISIKSETKYDKKNLYDNFLKAYPELKTKLKQRDFTNYLREWAVYNNFDKQESHSGEIRHITFLNKHDSGTAPSVDVSTIEDNNIKSEEHE
jgi:hypothetical protein